MKPAVIPLVLAAAGLCATPGVHAQVAMPGVHAQIKNVQRLNSDGEQGSKSRDSKTLDPGASADDDDVAGAGGNVRSLQPAEVEEEETPIESHTGTGDAVPETHLVKKGDSMWKLCEHYFQDPWKWPQLWAENPLITNPHWIFPGDVVRLQAAASAPVGASAAPPPPESKTLFALQAQAVTGGVSLRETAFVDPHELVTAGEISGSREEKIMLAAGDQVYVTFAADQPLRAGERYSIYDVQNMVHRPTTGEPLGYFVRIHGDVVVDQVTDGNVARGTLVDVIDPIERKYRVGPLYRQFKTVEPRPNASNLEALVAATIRPNAIVARDMLVVIDRGKDAGLQEGNRLFVIRRGDGYRKVAERWSSVADTNVRYPKEVVGEFLVVSVRDNVSIAWLVRASKEVQIGDRLEMRIGY